MMPRPLRILHVVQNLNYGGMERLLAEIIRGIDSTRFESHVMCLQYFGRFADGLAEHATLHASGVLPRSTMIWPGPLARRIAAIAPDVVHSHSGVWYKVSLAAKAAGVRHIVHTEHGRKRPDPWLDRAIDRRAARRTHAIVAVSDMLGQQLTETVVEDASRVQVIRNGVPTDRFLASAGTSRLEGELGLSAQTPVIGSIGRLEQIKGYDVMLRAYAALRRDSRCPWPAPALVVAGDGSEAARLRDLASSLGIADGVYWLGWRDDVHDLHAAFDLFTMSSRSEGTSVSLLEAMSSGLCPIVTDVGGNGAVLGAELRHRLVPPLDPDAMAEGWLAALLDSVRCRKDGAVARARVVERFGIASMIASYERLYDRGVPRVPATSGRVAATNARLAAR